jgi:hypothetical protein
MEMQFVFNHFLPQFLATGKSSVKNMTIARSVEQRQAKEDLRDYSDDRHERVMAQSSVSVTSAGIKVVVSDERGPSFPKETRLLPGPIPRAGSHQLPMWTFVRLRSISEISPSFLPSLPLNWLSPFPEG